MRRSLILFESARLALRNPGRTVGQTIKDPTWALKRVRIRWILQQNMKEQSQFIAYLTGATAEDIGMMHNQLKSNISLFEHLDQCFQRVEMELQRGQIPDTMGLSAVRYGEASMLYVITRALKPKIIVETGVGHGVSATFFLQALEDNEEEGRLYSIDLPLSGQQLADGSVYLLPEGKQSGWMIPEHLRHRWHLVLGSSSEKLLPLLESLGEVDVFMHDSLHTEENMMWEYKSAWPFIRKGGLLLSHDVSWNAAFLEFCRKVDAPVCNVAMVIGGIVKRRKDTVEKPHATSII